MNAPTDSHAKRIADQELHTQTDWYHYKQDIMSELLMVKIEHCCAFKDALLQSGNDELIENTDNEYWARVHSDNGSNMLGRLFMQIRSMFLNQNDPETHRRPANGDATACYNCGE